MSCINKLCYPFFRRAKTWLFLLCFCSITTIGLLCFMEKFYVYATIMEFCVPLALLNFLPFELNPKKMDTCFLSL